MGSGLPASIFDLGIGPKINAQWTIGLLTFFKIGSLKKDLEELQKSGREVLSSTAAPVHENGACMKSVCCALQLSTPEAWSYQWPLLLTCAPRPMPIACVHAHSVACMRQPAHPACLVNTKDA